MGVGGCLGSGAIQNHLVGFQLGTILTDQSHISKVWVIIKLKWEKMFLFSIWFFYLSSTTDWINRLVEATMVPLSVQAKTRPSALGMSDPGRTIDLWPETISLEPNSKESKKTKHLNRLTKGHLKKKRLKIKNQTWDDLWTLVIQKCLIKAWNRVQ